MAVVASFAPVAPRVAIASASDTGSAAALRGRRYPFSPQSRLRRPAEFSAVFQARKVLRGSWFNVHLLVRTGGEGARLGLVIPKKLLRSAVARNLTKRIVREAFRHKRERLPDTDFVVRLVSRPGRSAGTLPRQALRAEIDRMIDRCVVTRT